jgi:hypothetical protein
MSTSSTGYMIIGLSLDNILEITSKSETFEIYEKKGNKTGKTETEIIYTITNKLNGKEAILSLDKSKPKLYVDELQKILWNDYSVKLDHPTNEFGLYHIEAYYKEKDLKDFILGIGFSKKTILASSDLSNFKEKIIENLLFKIRKYFSNI